MSVADQAQELHSADAIAASEHRGDGIMRQMKWPLVVPLVALGVLAATFLVPPNAALLLLYGVALIGAVISAVHHAEVVAHRRR